MSPKKIDYENKIKMKYQVYHKEKAYIYNRGYIMGLSDSGAIEAKEGCELIDLNGLLRRKK